MNFNSRETYLNAVRIWKSDYKEASQRARDLKVEFKEAQRNLDKIPYGNAPGRSVAYRKVEALRSERYTLRSRANEMLATRQAMKEDAQRQYKAEQATGVIA